jgi:hypothetical protein
VARPRYPKHTGPPPPALPPALQTVGQLVAETLRLYGNRFLLALPLGLPLAVADQLMGPDDASDRLTRGTGWADSTVVLVAMSPAFSLAFVGAAVLATHARPSLRDLLVGLSLGTVAFALAAPLLPAWVLGGLAVLALVGHVVPAAVAEGRGPVDALRRSLAVARADYAHALGGLATLVVLFYLTRILLEGLLRSQADNTVRVAVFLSDLVLSPVIMLGGALLFVNLAARVGFDREERKRARAEAMAAMRGGGRRS